MRPAHDRTITPTEGNIGRRLYDVVSSRRSVDLMVLVLPLAAACGSFIRVVGPIFGFRVVLLIFLGITALKYRSLPLPLEYRSVRLFTFLAIVWLLVGYVSILWAVDKVAAIKELFSVSLGLALVIGFLTQCASSDSIARNLIRGWVIAFMGTGVIGIYERLSGHHLSNYRFGQVQTSVDLRLVATFFGNPNAYAAFLVTAFPFLLWGLMTARSKSSRLFFVANLSALLVLLLFTGSRLCLLAMFIQGLVAVIIIATRPYRLAAIAGSVLVVAAILTGITAPLARAFPFLSHKIFSDGGVTALVQEVASPSGSGGVRLNLVKDGLWMVSQTRGVGVGAGNFEANVAKAPFSAYPIINPHDLWIEVLSQYGVLVFLLFVTWLIWCLLVGFRLLNHKAVAVTAAAKPLGLTIVVSVVGNVLAAMANSSYLESSINWVFLGSLGVLTITAERMLSDIARSTANGAAEDKLRLA